eukprot:148365_1
MISSENIFDSFPSTSTTHYSNHQQNYLHHNNYNEYNNMVYDNTINYHQIYSNQRGGYNSSRMRWSPYNMNCYQHTNIPLNINFVPTTNTYYNTPNIMSLNGRNYDENIDRFSNSNGFINSVFNDEHTNYYGNYNQMAVDAVNNMR